MKNLIVLFLFLYSNLCDAKYTQTCTVKYKTKNEWSKSYNVSVNFLTGYELNQAVGGFNYESYSIYAVIFWGQGQASVIKLNGFFACGLEVSQSCIVPSLTDYKGKDQDGDEWNICVSAYCY